LNCRENDFAFERLVSLAILWKSNTWALCSIIASKSISLLPTVTILLLTISICTKFHMSQNTTTYSKSKWGVPSLIVAPLIEYPLNLISVTSVNHNEGFVSIWLCSCYCCRSIKKLFYTKNTIFYLIITTFA
jgi:hypothetical protein